MKRPSKSFDSESPPHGLSSVWMRSACLTSESPYLRKSEMHVSELLYSPIAVVMAVTVVEEIAHEERDK
jgi:hypothetical protein